MLAEDLMVAARWSIGEETSRLIDGLVFEIAPRPPARRMAQAYRQWGKGIYPQDSIGVTASPMR